MRLRILLGALLCAVLAPSARAHPHVWVEMRSHPVFDEQGRFSAVKVEWTFDDAYAQVALDGLDADGDGAYSQDELELLTRENIDSLKDYDYFIHVKVNGESVAHKPVTAAGQAWKDDKLTLNFVFPLAVPVDPRADDVRYRIYDPEFFVAFDYTGHKPVGAIGAVPRGCKLKLEPVVADDQTEQTKAMLATKGRDWKPPEEEDFGAMFAQPVDIACR